MQKKLNWRLEPPNGLILTSQEHVQLCPTAHEEDQLLHLDHSYKVVVEEMQVPYKEGDEAIEGDAVVDGIAVVKEEQVTLHRPNLAHSVITVASMDTMPHSVLKEQAHLAVAILHSL